ncbi:MAG TPA: penicillin-binding protein 2 [Anaerolineaceae bacterium]|nr:penicillin-binding protein 2 [Anaerolineaceae bacterium]
MFRSMCIMKQKMKNNNSVNTLEKWRFKSLYILMVIIFVFYGFRLFSLQIIDGEDYTEQAEENRTTNISIATERGVIYDRNGIVLAKNAASYNVTITPADLPLDEGAMQAIYRELSEIVDVPVTNGELTDEVVKTFSPCNTDLGIAEIVIIADTNAPYTPMQVKCDIDEETAMLIESKAEELPGVEIEIEPIREYPTGELTSEIIGFLGPIPESLEDYYTELGFVPGRDKVGYAGVEATMQEELGGSNGLRVVEEDVAGKVIRDLELPVDPEPGLNIKLTIDTRLQEAAKAALVGNIDWWNRWFNDVRFTNGVVIAMNPKTGEILSLVSYPTYENNRMARFIPAYYYEQLSADPNRPLFNHAISAEHPPGSVYKIVTAIGAINEGVVSPYQSLITPYSITITEKYAENDAGTPREFVDWKEGGHGQANFFKGLSQSVDVYFYKISGGYQDEVKEGLGIWRMSEYAKALGYGEITGIELPGEANGLVPTPTWKRINLSEVWSTGDTYIAGMGQGYVLATPLQILTSYAIVANDGVYMKPTVIEEIIDENGNVVQPFEPQEVWDITTDPLIEIYDENNLPTGEKKVVESWVLDMTQQALRMTVTEGTALSIFEGMEIPTSGKTGTAEYCDNIAQEQGLCEPGNWPAHAWYVGYGPTDDPEIAVIAFVYNGTEGSSVAAPIVRQVLEAYFELKAIDEGNE